MPRPGPFERVLRRLVPVLESSGIRYMVIGGVAATFRGGLRATRDLDVTILLKPEEVPALLRRLGRGFSTRVRDVVDFSRTNGMLPLTGPGGVRVDVLLAAYPFEMAALERATTEKLGTTRVRVCGAEELVLYKLAAGRPDDLEDVKAILRASGKRFDRRRIDRQIRALAEDLGNLEIQELWLGLFRRKVRRRE